MRKRFILLLIATLALMSVNARQISEQEAQLKAEKFFGKQGQNHSNMRRVSRKAPKLILASNREELYIFNDEADGGYVVISGDDRMPDVLAYSYDGVYDDNNIPDNMKAWLDDYAGQVAYLRSHPDVKVKRQTATEREEIDPLLTCMFHQHAPYNNKCPEINGKRCPTGCVATAMAQIMYYYQWPKQTTEVIPGYTTGSMGIVIPDQPITTIDWDNIRGEYRDNYSNEEADAISNLMLLCGTAVMMYYDPSGSSAFWTEAYKAFTHYFGYDDVLDVFRRGSDTDSWEELIYEELRSGRPVCYGGFNEETGGGHQFVMDGFFDGYFHVNWGWGGANSYVLMTDVGGYNMDQIAFIGLQPAYPHNPCRYAVFDNGKMSLYYDTEKEHRSGTVIHHIDDWYKYQDDITECEIDSSFANLKQISLSYYFSSWSQLRSIDGIENLNTDNVKYMYGMFSGCSSLTNLDLSGFNTEKVANMGYMFSGCSSLRSLDLSSFKTGNVKNMKCMFYDCHRLKGIYVDSGWTTANVKYSDDMFYFCSNLVGSAGTIYDWDHIDHTYAHIDGGASHPGYFRNKNLPDPPEPYTVLTDDNTILTFYYDDQLLARAGVEVYDRQWESYSREITTVIFDESFAGCTTLTNTSCWFEKCSQLKNIVGIDNLRTDNVMDMYRMFSNCSSLTNLDLSGFNTEKVANMGYMFSGCSSLTNIDLSGFKTDSVNNMSNMFCDCSSLTNIDLSSFNTDNVTDMNAMFSRCSNLTNLDLSSFNTANVTNMSGMFSGCSNLTNLDLSSFNTANVTNMSGMFSGCSSLTNIDLCRFKTDNVTNMESMFFRCSCLKKIFVSAGWTINSVISGKNMFYGCSQLMGSAGTRYDWRYEDYTFAHIDGGTDNPGYLSDKNSSYPYAFLSEDNTILSFYYDDQMESRGGMNLYYGSQWHSHSSEITTVLFDKSFADCTTLTSTASWFYGCSKLKNIVGLNNLSTDNVTDMYRMFSNCSSLTSLDLSSFNTANVTRMNRMFYECRSLTSLDLSSFNTNNVNDMSNMFDRCENLKRIYVGAEWTTNNVTSGDEMFDGCSKLIGGAGTRYDWNHSDYTYAHIDVGAANPGYFRDKNLPDTPEPYALLSNDNTILTFYYDDQMEPRGGIDVYEQHWSNYSGYITTVVFDESFTGYTTLTSMASWFEDCSNLKNIIGIENLRTDNVTDMRDMFSGCSGLTSLDLSNFKTDNVTDMRRMFYNCENLKTLYVREGWNTANVGNSDQMFSYCLKLVGGSGTIYNSNHTTADYAHIDGGLNNPGYLTYKDTHKTLTYMLDGKEYKSCRLEIGKDITPEPKPIKDGYVFIGWNDIPATMPDHDVVVTGAFYPYGDVNTDKDVDVLDVVDIARYVVEIPSESFVKQLADINKDGNVNLGDAVTLVNEIAGEQNFVRAKASPKENYTNDIMSLTEWNGSLSLNLQNERNYTAFQFDLYVPEGSDVTQMSLNTKRKQGHQLLYNRVKDGHYRVAALSTSNNEFIGNDGELLIVVLNGLYNDEVSIRNIHFFDVKGNDYLFDDIEGANTTSLTPSLSKGEGDVIYDLQGRKRLALQRGVNIVGGKKVVIK